MNYRTSFILIIVLFSLSLAQTKKAAKETLPEYSGPLGLKWGMTSECVDSILSGRFTLERGFLDGGGVDSAVDYKGTFSGFSNSTVQTMFMKNKLFAITVQIPPQGEFPISKTWFDAVDKIKEKYGLPKEITLPPKGISSSISSVKNNYPSTKNSAKIKELLETISFGTDDFSYWDMCIRKGSWEPFASWIFKNAVITIMINLSNPDKNNYREASIIWMFLDGKDFAKWLNKNDSLGIINKDF